ncbi:MAG: NAD(P)-dependent oxidoreductase [Candidatus Hermodarchaeia archaeon]|jgi:D-3-phosphoglycerate dehydrogenase
MKILLASSIDPVAIQALMEKHDVVCVFDQKSAPLEELIRDRDVLVFRSGVSITSEIMKLAPDLDLVVRAGSGIDNLDVNYVNQHGLKLVRIPEPGAKAVAEMSFALMLALSRNLFEADRTLRNGEWKKYELQGYLLSGKVLGIIGAGNIGSRVGQLGNAFGMDVIAYDVKQSQEYASGLAKDGINLTGFLDVISTADYISLHVPLDDSTYHMINSEVLSQVKPGAYLINMARGGVVDEIALFQALVDGSGLKGAALDVHEKEGEDKTSPLAGLSNVILTPHIGAMTVDSQREIGQIVVETINSFEEVKR